ncbi:MAG TPA: glycosyltransferase [Terracidiphilus sp.]|jgi:glycosyltransferase involved in cell wall biosynthesis
MVIVYVLTSLGMGGAERQVVALATRMADRGHAVKLLVLRPRIAEQWPTTLPVIHLDMRRNLISVLKGLARARRFLRGYRPDLIHSHSFHANLIARFLKLLVRAPIVLSTVHNVYEGGLHRMAAYRLSDFLSTRTTAVSSAAAERFVRMKAVPRNKCMVITNGIDTHEFCPNADRRAQTRVTMSADGEFIWLAAGRITVAKDYPNMLRAFARVKAARPPTCLWVAGDVAGVEFERVKKLTADLHLEGAVHWLGLRRDLPALLDAADGFVLASAWEGMPLVVGEAMAMQKPVVATDVGGVHELVGDAGTLVLPKDFVALADAMLEIMRSAPEWRVELGRLARLRICEQFSMDAKADEWEALYNKVRERDR